MRLCTQAQQAKSAEKRRERAKEYEPPGKTKAKKAKAESSETAKAEGLRVLNAFEMI